jgi:hypothetical protein
MRIAFAALAVALGACAARTGLDAPEEEDASAHDATTHDASHPHDAGIDAPIVFVDASPSPLCASSDAGIPKSVCATNVHVGHITVSMTTCFVDLVVHEGDNGVVSYACNGDPSTWADAIFPDGGFVGTIAGSNVDLCTGTVFPWSDGCTWASAQKITGDLDSGTLSFTYEETPIEGGSCEPPCSAQGTILVQ